MTQVTERDQVIPVTVLKAGPCVVVQKKETKDGGYNSIQLGFEDVKEGKLNKPQSGHFKKCGTSPRRYLHEVRMKDEKGLGLYKVGGEVNAGIFKKGDLVRVSGISKGKGFAGVMKRHGFKGGPASHGAGGWQRRGGSIGASADPSRVFKGKKMPGRMGGKRVTIKNLRVLDVDEKQHLLLIQGSCPGKNGDLVIVREETK